MDINTKVPVIFDTDIGSDIDDAVCLAYLLAQPRCDLLGITTVSGEPIKRAQMASALCIAAGRPDIPILSGCDVPIQGRQQQPMAPQAEALANWPHQSEFESYAAVDWMRKTIRSRPGEITLLAVGPMTNVGLLFRTDPEIPKLLKKLVLMCGVFTPKSYWSSGPGAKEWNALNDPVATAITYEAEVKEHLSIGLDVTSWCRMPADEVRNRFTGPVLSIVRDFAEVWFRHSTEITFHDPLAGVSVFEPDVCTWVDGKVDVETASAPLGGLTSFRTDLEAKPHRIALEVDAGKFFDRYFAVVGA